MRAPLLILIPAVTAIVWAASPAYRTDAPRAVDERMPPDECVEAPAPVEPAAGDAAPTVHHATTVHGAIGALDAGVPDEPADNLFHVHLGRAPQATEAVWLEYELRGLTDHDGVPRSINHGPSIGGQRARPTADWSQQRERVRPASLREGRNSIWFHAPGEGMPGYEVRNVRFVVGPDADVPGLVITNKAIVRVQGKVHLKGFINATGADGAQVEANGQAIACHDGVFEGIVEVTEGMESAQISALLSDGRRVGRSFAIMDVGDEEAITAAPSLRMLRERVDPVAEHTLRLAEAELTVPAQALSEPREISMFGLPRRDVPPTGQDLVNVTAQGGGYRFLPDGTTFNVPVGITLGYDPALIPEGYGPEDIRTFYFDEGARRWMALPRDTVRTDAQLVRSRTTHFTDYINGIIQVPESPETMGYTPTSIKDYKAGDVSAGIAPMPPPAANNTGAATTRFPLKLPQGRQGMQPDLAIQYNSEGGNGWLGLGWNLSTPSITIETRWGVPRYDLDNETETYLLDGEMMSPVAHRTEWVARNTSGDKTFHTRVEGSFRRIKRKGNAPKDYWWEVTEKDGTRKFYGGDGSSVEENAVLRIGSSSNSAIAKWMLHKEVDRNGNTVTYTYEPINHAGTVGSPNMGRQIYPKRIRYTGREGEGDGPYLVEFDFNDTSREDKQVNCRLGFKEVTANLLKRVTVKYDGATVRSYRLSYSEGAFKKTRLDSIVEYDADDVRFYGHGFEYYDDVRPNGEYVPYAEEQDWSGPNLHEDGLFYTGENPFVDLEDRSASLLSGSRTENWNLGGSANVGPPGNTNSQKYSIGGSFGHSRSSGSGMNTLVDMDGDNLPDKVYRSNDVLFYRPNLTGTGTLGFGDPIPLLGAGSHFSQTKTRSVNYGLEVHANPAFYGKNWTKSTTRTPVYLIDRNGDGLMDITRNGMVFFNYRGSDGHPHFSTDVGLTQDPIESGAPVAQHAIDQAEVDELLQQSPLIDVVRVWVAPYKGTILIHAPITLQPDDSYQAEEYEHEDGVRATIQLREDEACSMVIPFGDTDEHGFPCSWLNAAHVEKGDKVYFRLNSVMDGAFDRVAWDPFVRYLNVEQPDLDPSLIPATQRVDANGKPLYEYSAASDLLLANDQSIALADSGVIEFSGPFHKPITSDDVTLLVIRSDANGIVLDTAFLQRFVWDEMADVQSISGQVPIGTRNNLSFKLASSSNVAWDSLLWQPEVYYVEHALLHDSLLFDDNGDPLILFKPVIDKVAFNEVRSENNSDFFETRIGRAYIPDSSGTIDVNLFVRYMADVDQGDSITLTVKRLHELVSKQTWFLPAGNENIQFSLPVLSFAVLQDSAYYVDITIPSRRFSDKVFARVYADSDVPDHNDIEDLFGIHTTADSTDLFFGPLHRRWGQFCYNFSAEGYSDTDLIEEDHLHPEGDANASGFDFDSLNEGDYENLDVSIESPLNNIFAPMWVVPDSGAWMGYDAYTYITRGHMSSSRLGEDDVSFLFTTDSQDTLVSAPVKVSKDSSTSRSWSVGYILGYSSNKVSGTTRSVVDALDLDGDRYPDVVKADSVQGTRPNGGYEPLLRPHPNGAHIGTSRSGENNWTASGSLPVPHFGVSGTMNAGKVASSAFNGGNPLKSLAKCVEAFGTSMGCIGLNVNLPSDPSESVDSVSVTWNDVNGDGLPDKVFKNGEVRLNIGRSFLPPEAGWGFSQVRSGSTRDRGYGGGVSIDNGSFTLGVSASESKNGTVSGLMDVNGDGLLDEVIASDLEDDLWSVRSVRFNTGSRFDEEQIDWPTGIYGQFELSRSIGESANGSFTSGVNLFIVRIVFNVNGSIGQGFSRSETQFSDVNGDGFPDFLHSTDDDNLHVLPSNIRRTNLLKSVSSPFGAGWQVDYEVAGNTYDLPQSKWVMKELLVWDGFAGDGPDTSRTTFAYADGKYSRRERETYGFGRATTHEWDTEANENGGELYRATVQTYDVSGYYTKGLPLVKTVQDGQANKYTETENTYALKLLNGTDAPDTYNATNDFGTAFPALVRTQDRFHEGQPNVGITRTVAFAYDAIGNVTQYVDSGHVGQDDVVVADIAYHDHPVVKSTPSGIVVRVEGEERRRRSQDLNDTGNVERIEQRIDDDATARYDLVYDVYGNLKWIQRPANHRGEHMHYDYTYDDVAHTYVTRVHDAYGHSSYSRYDLRFGQLTGTTDMNGQETRYTVDDRGRVTAVTGPYELASNDTTIKIAYFENASPPYSVVTHFDPEHPDSAGIRTVTFLDGLFRPLQVKKSAVIREENGNEMKKWIVSGRVKFDAFGRTVASRYPVTSTAAIGQFVGEEDTEAPTTTTFDVLDRPLLETLPDGAETATAYSIENANGNGAAFRTRVTDALLNIKDSYTDVREREILRTDHGPNGAINTTFRYNGIGELLTVADNDDNETSYTYDQLGRKLNYDHPDGGLTAFTYDPAGNLLTKNTANLRELFPDGGPVKYTYDHQRLVRIDYPRNYQNQVVYTYGDSTEAEFNRVGRVKLQLDASGGQEFFYGPLGEVERTIRTIVVSQSDIRTFVSEERYDTWNRIQEMRYPDGEVVSYAYNTAGKLKQVTSEKSGFSYDVVSDIGYDKFEQRVYLRHGNNVETRYAYEPDRRRLSTLKVKQPDGTHLMDNRYTYDRVNNILALENQRPVPADGQGGPMSSTYGYDNLYRLTHAEGNYTGSARQDHYALTMVYDDLHNITNKTQTHSSTFPTATLSNYDNAYAYEGGRPHTPSRVGHTTYTWDANGNLADREEDAPRMGNRQLAWDEENRLQALTDEGYVSQYTYDAAGERVLKSHGGMQGVFINGAPVGLINHRDNYTIYVSPYLVHAQHGFTKHYFIEGQRVASRTGTGQFLQGPLIPPGITAGRVNFRDRILAMQQGATQQAVQNAPVPGMPTMPNYNGQPEISGNPYYMGDIGTYAAPEPGSGWPMPPTPPGAPGTPPTTPTPSVTNETVQAGYAFQNQTNQPEYNRYFFHPDHLGSASYITGMAGTARQHLEYMAFGETFVEEHNAADPLDYLFNGKELDRITGLYYYGARYYDPVMSLWASVDPMAEKIPQFSPYNYALQNPIALEDPDGEFVQLGTGILNMAIDYGIETASNRMQGKSWAEAAKPNVQKLAISFVSGAVGVGLAAKVTKSAALTGALVSATASATSQSVDMMQGERAKFSLSEMGSDAILGAGLGKIGDKIKRTLNAPLDKINTSIRRNIRSYLRAGNPDAQGPVVRKLAAGGADMVTGVLKDGVNPGISSSIKGVIKPVVDPHLGDE